MIEDGEWTDMMGQTAIGRKEVEHMHVYPFTSVLGEAALTSKSLRIKWIKDDVASIDVAWESRGYNTPDGTPIPNVRSGLLNLVSREEQKGVWNIVVGHNVDYATAYIQSDRKRALNKKSENKNGH